MDTLIEQLHQDNIIKECPNCGIWTEKIDGCNFLDCLTCHAHWCWLCTKIKTLSPVPQTKEAVACCDDKTHNSH